MEAIVLRDVLRLPALKTRVAIFAVGIHDREDFHTAVVDQLLSEGPITAAIPDVDAVYHETWRFAPYQGDFRLVRCKPEFGTAVTAIDLKKWSRGRRIKEAKEPCPAS